MRTDIKVGAIVAIVLMVVGMVWYFAYYRPGQQATTSPAKTGQQAKKTGGQERSPMRVRTRTPEGSGGTLTPSYVRTGDTSGGAPPGATGGQETTAKTPGTGDLTAATRSTAATQGITYKPPSRTTGKFSWETRTPSRLTGDDSAPSASSGDLWPATQQAPTTYVVKRGDTYWTMARDKYGDGSLWRVIQDANPNIPPKALRPGMTVKVPPKPRRTVTVAARSSDASTHGSSGVDAVSGKRWYVIKKGDNGYWDASKALFGTGRHNAEIAAMNPGVDPKKLHPGDKIWVPIRPTVTTRPVAVAARSASRPAVGRTVARTTARVETGAPTRTVLPDGRVFD